MPCLLKVDINGKVVPNILTKKEEDLAMGDKNEVEIIDKLKRTWNDPSILNTKEKYGKYCYWDWENDLGTKWEQKSRRNTKNRYDTTLFPVHKIGENEGKFFCVFRFTDGDYYIEYNKEQFSTFGRKMLDNLWRDGKREPPKDHYEIPVNLLTPF